MTPSRDISRLLEIMAALRNPVSGCPWDCEQTFASIAPFTLEEAYEVVDAIERGDLDELRDELGDLLLQVVYHAQLAQEQGRFAFADVVEAITSKLIRRHPHVFGDIRGLSSADVASLWDTIKTQEKAARVSSRADDSVASTGTLAGVATALPALTRAVKLTLKASRVGFDWGDVRLVLGKIREELDEVAAELDAGPANEAVTEEIGDLLFAVANLARHAKVDPEAALRRTNEKFIRRFGFIEAALAREGRTPEQSTLFEMDRLWDEAKAHERAASVSPGSLSLP